MVTSSTDLESTKMRYNLNKKKQRKQFNKDCSDAIQECPQSDGYAFNKDFTPREMYNFWANEKLLNSYGYDNYLTSEAINTLNYYYLNGVKDLEQ